MSREEINLAFSSADASMKANTSQIAERSRYMRRAVERYTRRRHVGVTASFFYFRFRFQLGVQPLPVSVSTPTRGGIG